MTAYVSTRGDAPRLGFCEAMLAGLARDGGLYVPETWPRLGPEAIAALAGRPYWEAAVEIIRPFVGGEISDADLGRMASDAYATFRHPAVVPLDQSGANQFVLELFHGPTLAFKDVAMQLIARLMDHALAARGRRTTIVVATSGDTGGAAVEAFAGRGQVDLVVLFPQGRISEVQRRMMTTSAAANVHAVAVEGTFDDCQALVKAMFNHHAFRDEVALSGVNSINWARIVAQTVYYFTAAVALGAPAREVGFTVPTGNFGDVFAGYVAKRMGLPIRHLTVATNVNDILARTLATGTYEVREVHATASPSMDIQVSSNFERLVFEATGRNAGVVRALMASLAQSGRFTLPAAALAAIRADFRAGRADEEEMQAAIRAAWREAGDLVDPHTAVALAVADRDAADRAVPNVVLSTAHAAKFPDAVEAACGRRPALPVWLDGLMTRPERIDVLANDQNAIERFVRSNSRAAKQGIAG
ncbi:MAG: threonine synthase [Proteobacteria bacterium]|nr:MAG: threonine synthase [Pseudomonadota bacterium]